MRPDFGVRALAFLAADKEAVGDYRWRIKDTNKEWAAASLHVRAPSIAGRAGVGRVCLTAHCLRNPPKYGFTLSYAGQRVFALDVGPARAHSNPITLEVIWATHWQTWPCDHAEAESRTLGYGAWFREFLARAKIKYDGACSARPMGVPLELPLEFRYDDEH